MTHTSPLPTAAEDARRVGVLGLARLWAPTALGSSLLAWEIPLVVALVASMAHGPQAMAALGAGLSVLVVVNSPALALAPLVVTEIHARGSQALSRQAMFTGIAGAALLIALAVLPGVADAFPALLGLPEPLRADFQLCLVSFATAPLAVALRRGYHGRLIVGNATGSIATATLVRIAVTVVAGLAARSGGAPAAVVGGIALSCGAWAEAAVLAWACRHGTRVPGTRVPGTGVPGAAATGGLLAQHARLTSVVLLNMSPALVTTAVVAWSREATGSLVVWPVLYGLVSLGTVPLSDVDSVGGAFLRRGGRRSVLLRFVLLVAGALLAGALLVAATPLARLFLEDFSHVPRHQAELGLRWASLLAMTPALWAVRGGLRAAAIADGLAGLLPRAAAVHLAVLLGVGAALSFTSLPGVAGASTAVLTALVAESVALWRLGAVHRRSARGSPGGRRPEPTHRGHGHRLRLHTE